MRYFLSILLAAGLCAATPQQNLQSHLLIDVGKQFVLGGNQGGAIRLSARNSGPVEVSVGERQRDGKVLERGRLRPRQSAWLEFAPGAAVLVRNLGRQQAVLDLKVRGAADSQMIYEPLSQTTEPGSAK